MKTDRSLLKSNIALAEAQIVVFQGDFKKLAFENLIYHDIEMQKQNMGSSNCQQLNALYGSFDYCI